MTKAPLFDVPNLDGLPADPADYRAAAKVLDLLADYAHCKALAMEHRARGNVTEATSWEEIADRDYRQLPEWARW